MLTLGYSKENGQKMSVYHTDFTIFIYFEKFRIYFKKSENFVVKRIYWKFFVFLMCIPHELFFCF